MTPCDQCRRGWFLLPNGWPAPCLTCGGSGEFSLVRLSQLTGVDESTLKRLWRPDGRTRVKTAKKVLDRVLQHIHLRQPELFR